MVLPLWKSADPAEQAALSQFVISELDRLDAEIGIAASGVVDAIHYLRTIASVQRQASSIGLHVPLPSAKLRPGPKTADPGSDDYPAFERAVFDVPRIRAIFKMHWGKRNRHQRPLAEDIAADRWSLTSSERAALIDKFQRKSSLSQQFSR